MSANYVPYSLDWHGIAVSISYAADWSPSFKEIYGSPMAHLEIRSLDGQPLPITETGYRSHFTNVDVIDAEGGPVEFVRAWLDHDAQLPAWQEAKAKRQQLSLF
jgi:hypothetical protein